MMDQVLVLGASTRLTRLVTTDDLGRRYLSGPVRRWAGGDARRLFWADALDCPFCVGFWIGAGVLASHRAASHSPRALALWRFGASALGLNYVVGHLSARLD